MEAARALTVHELPPTIAIGTIAGDNTVNAAEAAAGVAIGGMSSGADGQTATITIVDGSNAVKDTYTVTIAAGGGWTANVTAAQAQALADGSYTVKADVSDAAGSSAVEATHTLTVDRSPPTATVTIAAITPDTASNDFNTSATSLTLTGSNTPLGAGETVQVSSDGGATWARASQTDAAHWSFADPATHNASFMYQVRVTDAAGNIDANTASQAVTIQAVTTTTAPVHLFTDNSARASAPPIAVPASLVQAVPSSSPVIAVGADSIGVSGNSFNFVHTDAALTSTQDASVKINGTLAALEASLGGDVASVVARQANGDPLPGWLKFDPATGQFAGLPPDPGTAGDALTASHTITVQLLVTDSRGHVATATFTVDVRTHAAGKQGWNIDRHAPFGSLRHAALPTTSPEVAAIEAAVRGVTIEPPLASRDMPVRHGDAITVGSGEAAPSGRAGLTEQMVSIGWRSMAAQRNALLASLQRR